MTDAGPLLTLQFQELSTPIHSAPQADLAVNLALPISADALARDVLRHAPPRPLQVEQAIEAVEDAVMPARAQLPATFRLQTGDALLRALAAHAAQPAVPHAAPHAGTDAAPEPQWLSIDAVEHLFTRLAARVEGRPASQDDLPVDGPSAARLVIVREMLHHWHLDGLLLSA